MSMANPLDLELNPKKIRNLLQEAMQKRVKRKVRNRGFSRVERLVPADVSTVIESFNIKALIAAVDTKGIKYLCTSRA